jgi:arylsulfatase
MATNPYRMMLRGLAVACLALIAPATPTAQAAQPERRPPNIIFILADDQGYQDLGCYGSPLIETPNIDRMAAEGMRFTDFYAASPLCTPSRAAFLTGCYPMRVSMDDFPIGPDQPNAKSSHVLYPNSPLGLNPEEFNVAKLLKSAGYSAHIVGKWHLGDRTAFLPLHQGFDSYFGLPNVNDQKPLCFVRGDQRLDPPVDLAQVTQIYTREAIQVIRENRDHPFFLYLPHTMPHFPIAASPEFVGKSKGGLYGDVVQELDWSVGQIFATLKELHLDDNTIVVYTSDNGPWLQKEESGGNAVPYRGGKGTTYEGGMRVPCIVWWPGHVPAGSVCHGLVAMMDFLPTFAAITHATAAIPSDRPIDGVDISSVLADPNASSPRTDLLYYGDENRLNAVRSGKWKLKFATTLQEETHYGKWENPQTKIPAQLYNLELDPAEQKSLLKDHPDVAKKLRAIADRAREDLGDAREHIVGKSVRPIGHVPTTQHAD